MAHSHERQHNCPGPNQLSHYPVRCQLLELSARLGALAENIGVSAWAEVRQMLGKQEATGLDFTDIKANPNLIPPQLKHPCEAVLLLLPLRYRARYPRDVC